MLKVYGVHWDGLGAGFEVAADHRCQVLAFVCDQYGIDKGQIYLERMGSLRHSALEDHGVLDATDY